MARRDVRRPRQRPADRPTRPEAYADDHYVEDVELVMDATDTAAAVLVGLCMDGVWRAIRLAAEHPDRVLGIVAFAVGVPRLAPAHPWIVQYSFDDELPTDEGWAKKNRHYWLRDYPGLAEWWFSQTTSEAHSTKAIEDAVGWAVDGSVEAMLAESDGDHILLRRRPGRGHLPFRHLPDAHRPWHGGSLPADRPGPSARRADRRAAGGRRGCEPHDPRPAPRAREPADPRLRYTRRCAGGIEP